MQLSDIAFLILVGSLIFHGMVTILLFKGLQKVTRPKPHGLPGPFVSLIVAARNEEQNIRRLLEAVLNQSYQAYEVIVVDDESTDATRKIVTELAATNSRLRLLLSTRTPLTQATKKAALSLAIQASKGEILCFTDADCVPGNRWIETIAERFADEVGMLAGYSPYDRSLLQEGTESKSIWHDVFQGFIRYEELKGAIWSAGSIGIGKGWLCTGRNLAYRRKVWDEVAGFEGLMMSISGDDDLFLQLVRRKTSWTIDYITDELSFVPTAPPNTMRAFMEQRKRHFSAGKYFKASMKVFFFLLHGTNLLLFLGLLLGIVLSPLRILCFFFPVKLLLDFILIDRGASIFKEARPRSRFLLMEILYLAYNTVVGPLGLLSDFRWKPDLTA